MYWFMAILVMYVELNFERSYDPSELFCSENADFSLFL